MLGTWPACLHDICANPRNHVDILNILDGPPIARSMFPQERKAAKAVNFGDPCHFGVGVGWARVGWTRTFTFFTQFDLNVWRQIWLNASTWICLVYVFLPLLKPLRFKGNLLRLCLFCVPGPRGFQLGYQWNSPAHDDHRWSSMIRADRMPRAHLLFNIR